MLAVGLGIRVGGSDGGLTSFRHFCRRMAKRNRVIWLSLFDMVDDGLLG